MAKGGITKTKFPLSDSLADLIGKSSATRGQVMKDVWAYIKKHGLQNPKKRRNIQPDDALAEVIGNKEITMFEMTAKISKHINPKD